MNANEKQITLLVGIQSLKTTTSLSMWNCLHGLVTLGAVASGAKALGGFSEDKLVPRFIDIVNELKWERVTPPGAGTPVLPPRAAELTDERLW